MKLKVFIFLSVLIFSCSEAETYVNSRDLVFENGKITLDGEIFNGNGLRIRTIGHPSTQNRVYDLTRIRNGIPVYFETYSIKEGYFNEIKLNNGLKTYASDLIESTIDDNFEIYYYPDGRIKEKIEIICENGNIATRLKNGKKEYFDIEGNIIKVDYYENGKKINKAN